MQQQFRTDVVVQVTALDLALEQENDVDETE